MDLFGVSPVAAAETPKIMGLLMPGNIDLTKRPKVRNPDGTISTVKSMSFNENGREVLIPMISEGGISMTPDQAVQEYRKTGKHLGIFDTPQNATSYAEKLHKQQERFYLGK